MAGSKVSKGLPRHSVGSGRKRCVARDGFQFIAEHETDNKIRDALLAWRNSMERHLLREATQTMSKTY